MTPDDLCDRLWGEARKAAGRRRRMETSLLLEPALRILRAAGRTSEPVDSFVSRCLRSWDEADRVRLPSARTTAALKANYSHHCSPPMPVFFHLVAENPVPDPRLAEIRRRPWHPKLQFLARQPRVANPDLWTAIDDWLKRRGEDDDVVGANERSWEIFRDEKVLIDKIRASAAVREGRFSLEDLRCVRVPEPLPARVRPGATLPSALVVENADTFRSACLANAEHGLYTAVVFGEGNAFPARAPDLKTIAEAAPFSHVDYWGDLDAVGHDIAMRARAAVLPLGLTFALAMPFYDTMLKATRSAVPFGSLSNETRAFLREEGAGRLILAPKEGRIPQEAVDRQCLRSLLRSMQQPPGD